MRVKLPLMVELIYNINYPDYTMAYSQKTVGFIFYLIMAWYLVLYPILIWLTFHRVGLYERLDRLVNLIN